MKRGGVGGVAERRREGTREERELKHTAILIFLLFGFRENFDS